MARQGVWQGFLDWIRPSGRDRTRRLDDGGSASFVAAAQPVRSTAAHRSSATSLTAEASYAGEFAESELLDFLAADLDPVSADPVFREALREQLWGLVQDGVVARPKDH